MSERDSADPGPGLPTREDFIPHGDLDEQWAYKRYGGRTLDEVRAIVAENWFAEQENFMWMGIRAFCFYLPAFFDYFEKRDFDCQEIRMLCSDCRFRVEDFQRQPALRPCAAKVLDGLVRVTALFESDLQRVASEFSDTLDDIEAARGELADARADYEKLLARL